MQINAIMVPPPCMSVEEAEEELLMQTVILDSLRTERFEGVEGERAEAERRITELRALLHEPARRESE